LASSLANLCRDLNRISDWLAADEFREGTRPSFDAIVLLGNQVLETLVAACQLARQVPQARLVFSGGIGGATDYLFANLSDSKFSDMVGDGRITASMTEAAMYAAVARDAFSIPGSQLMVEQDSTHTGENVRFTLRMLRDAGMASSTVVLAQDPLLLRRALATWDRETEREGLSKLERIPFAAFLPRVEPAPNGRPQLVQEQRQGSWSMERYLGLLLGEVERLRDDADGYGPRGRDYFDHVDIPEAVWDSYLKVRGSPLGQSGVR
jgi:uncharacterized SAM-binding protein YcdF (DUF218 family)